jgi:hypothetical protein
LADRFAGSGSGDGSFLQQPADRFGQQSQFSRRSDALWGIGWRQGLVSVVLMTHYGVQGCCPLRPAGWFIADGTVTPPP